MQLSIYDMDKTITRKPSWTSWLFFYARREAPWRLLLVPFMLVPSFCYVLGLLDRKGLKQATQWLLMGGRVPRAKVERAAKAFADDFGRRMELPGALESMAQDKAEGRQIWMATASCRFYAEVLAARWPVDRVIATENVWQEDHLRHHIRGENCYDIAKLRMILAAMDQRPAHVRFLSDHASDLPALMWADEAIATSPSPALRAMAQARGWQIRDWA